jgi:predicted phage-related endonuclease
MVKIIEVEQGSEQWLAERLGHISASNMHKIISPTGKQSTQAEKYITELIAEIISGESADPFKGNVHTERGKTLEEEAADYYAMLNGVEPQKIGILRTDDGMISASPDRLIGDDGMLEIKTCLPRIMVEQYEKESLEEDHRPQTQCQLFVSGRKWIDTLLYCPNMKPIIVRSEPKQAFIMDMVRFTKQAHNSLVSRLAALKEKGFVDEDPSRLIWAG